MWRSCTSSFRSEAQINLFALDVVAVYQLLYRPTATDASVMVSRLSDTYIGVHQTTVERSTDSCKVLHEITLHSLELISM